MTSVDLDGNIFPKLTNDCILKAAFGERTDKVPVWIMRQAGRYLPEFRELRKEHEFFKICETPHLACEVTLMPIRRFNLDAAIIFSDILVIPQALGMTVEMTSKGPSFPYPLKIEDEFAINKLDKDVNLSKRLHYVYKAISITRHALEGKCPLIGFSGAPWTLMGYMIEGGGSKTMSNSKKWLYQRPQISEQLLNILTTKVTEHLVEQAKAGAQLLQLFESSAEFLNLKLFEKFAYPSIIKICTDLKKQLKDLNINNVPIIVFAKGGHYAMELFAKHENVIDVLSLDWTMDPKKIRAMTGISLQGNLDPCCMYCCPKEIPAMVEEMLNSFGSQKYIANLGHGIYPDAKIETVEAFVNSVHEISSQYNKSRNKN